MAEQESTTAPAEGTFASTAREKLNSALGELSVKADEAGRVVKKGLSQAEVSVRQGMDVTERRIRENPLVSVGIAAGVGLILGLLINRNR